MLLKEVNKELLERTTKESHSIWEVLKKLNLPQNGRYFKKIDKLITKLEISISHFGKGFTKRKYKRIIRLCPVCKKEFLVREGSKRQKRVCSRSCSNSYFRKGKAHPNYKDGSHSEEESYRGVCFRYHKKQCIVCEENRVVEVHHFDGNKHNNSPENLIPLCPTHHQYIHSKFSKLIIDKLIEYHNEFISTESSSEEERTVWGGKVEIS